MRIITLIVLGFTIFNAAFGQTQKDTTKTKELKEVIIKAWQRRDIARVPEEQNGFLNSGKKNEVITYLVQMPTLQ